MKTDSTAVEEKLGANGAAPPEEKASFAETALTMGGKSADEARRTGAIDKADDQVEDLFKYKTTASPAFRAIWDTQVPVDLFSIKPAAVPADVQKVMDASLDVVRKHKAAGTLYNADKKIDVRVLDDLGTAGYWGLLVSKEYGGSGAPFTSFATFLTKMAMLEATVSGLASVHGCIGAVDPLRTFGTPEQKKRFLPKLASGERLSAFALTEPCAGSDLTQLRTEAKLDGSEYVVNGEKLFITNVVPGRTVGLVCLINNKPSVLIVDLPEQENEQFQLKKYGLYAIKGAYNRGIIFKDFRVPAENLLKPKRGDGLTIAYHGLNLGRVSLCANAAGAMRQMLISMVPWAQFRRTYGQAISTRELVQRRLGCTAGLIVACDAVVEWCAGLLDQGYRGEMECIIAKIFGSEAQKHVAIEYFMKTHGGRSFLEGHMFGDMVHEFLAPCIYEGEGEMLGMAFFKSLVKEHGVKYFQPIGEALMKAGIRQPSLANPAHLWALKGPMANYAKWMMSQKLRRVATPALPPLPAKLAAHAEFAADFLQRSPLDISGTMSKHQLALADRQCRMAEISQRLQDATVILCTALYAGRQNNEIIRDAADVACQDLTRRISGKRPTDSYYKTVTKLGKVLAEDGGWKSFSPLDNYEAEEILMPYKRD
ncbi:MAG: acyl-CoA dehydrogenase family protein [Planctomycetaceae bacterium]|nr:acyl-CoA dehydrogenase family protein [Planctomycetaceae bacterium]